jgi:hypothetical protein
MTLENKVIGGLSILTSHYIKEAGKHMEIRVGLASDALPRLGKPK